MMLRAIFAILNQTLTKLQDAVSALVFSPSLSQALTKLHDVVSALTRFLEFKPDHMFGCILDRQACTPTFMTFQAIFTPFKPNPVETARRSFPFEQFLRI